MKKILVAVDSFKGSMTSLEAGAAIENGIKSIRALLDGKNVLWQMAERARRRLLYMEETVSAESDVM